MDLFRLLQIVTSALLNKKSQSNKYHCKYNINRFADKRNESFYKWIFYLIWRLKNDKAIEKEIYGA